MQPRYALIDHARNGSVEQISGANEQIPERGQTYVSGIGPKVMLGPFTLRRGTWLRSSIWRVAPVD
jgi:hypothetical protein